ncbi:hypothetical protein Y1Q_0024638 [Alligator mississippiensis]|uniref:Uncharacterized protein n=1 Tax=Alligator mississippiensis TaxID=8496 RepID=A0A151NB59_ALLMI|nr:hypothetical protein Y1Q_0024638 [Alligator mississippiensis]
MGLVLQEAHYIIHPHRKTSAVSHIEVEEAVAGSSLKKLWRTKTYINETEDLVKKIKQFEKDYHNMPSNEGLRQYQTAPHDKVSFPSL